MLIMTQKKDGIINLRNVGDVFAATYFGDATIETQIYAGVVSGTKMMLGKHSAGQPLCC